jgi:nicotinamidase-related amidase
VSEGRVGRSALVIGDVQRGLVDAYGAEATVRRLGACAEAARGAGVPVFFVTVGLRQGHPEVHPANAGFAAVAASGMLDLGSETAEVHPGLARRPSEPVVRKSRVSGFFGTDLELLVRAAGVEHLVLGGISTSGVVLSTYRDATDRDFGVTVLSDGCADNDDEVHRVLVEKLFPKQASVRTCAEWMASLGASGTQAP